MRVIAALAISPALVPAGGKSIANVGIESIWTLSVNVPRIINVTLLTDTNESEESVTAVDVSK